MKKNLLIVLTFVSILTHGQQKLTLSGYVKDASNGEELIGVTVYIKELATGTTTNPYGFYSITLTPGTYNVQYSYIGYTSQLMPLKLDQNISKNIELVTEAQELTEVVVKAEKSDANVKELQMSKTTLNLDQIRKLPAAFGESDIIKNVQIQPGVISAGEGTSSFFVRGGGSDQNLILIDEAPVYDPSHLFGLFSVFNSDVVKASELYRGGIPARFGGRLSSILEVRTKDGNDKKFAGTGGIGLLASRLAIEGPIVKDKSSFILSGRRSYVDLFQTENKVYFYDLNGKVNWRINNNNRIFFAFYSGRDQLGVNKTSTFGWGNTTATGRWNHVFNDRLFLNATFIYSNFDYKLESKDPSQGYIWKSQIQQLSLNNDFTYYLNLKNEISFGYHLSYRKFQPGTISPNTAASLFSTVELEKEGALDHALYLDNKQKLSDRVTVSYGVRLSIFQNVGQSNVIVYGDRTNDTKITRSDTIKYKEFEVIKTYVNWEPRVSFHYLLNESSSIKASYNRMVQNTHLISSGTIPLPFNTWAPSGTYLKPQIADQYAIGYFKNFANNKFEVSVEAYYKDLDNVTDFKDNAQVFFNKDLAAEYRQGKSQAKGIELSLQKKEGRLTGSLSYTLSEATRTVPGVNQGNPFPANYDRRNVVNLTSTFDLNTKWAFGMNFTYSTGRPITLPSGRYELDGYNVDLISSRNGYRLPDFHRLDISATYTPTAKKDRRWKGQWVFSIYNVYNNNNPFSLYTRVAQDSKGNVIGDGTQKEARLTSLFPILPSVTYNFKF
ncbi:MAG: TonB-dependent receptor [Cyclobacteriaceae bacterium]